MAKNDEEAARTVFAIIPTFNRFQFTRTCIERLKAQTHQPLIIMVSDGGSTDGTRELVASAFPDVVVLHDGIERWWAGSTALGVEEVYKRAGDDDYVLLINNDTEIPADYVATLVATSAREGNAAVGAKVVDSRDENCVLDAGEFIQWSDYSFPVKTTIEPGEVCFAGVDVLPGRGSLIPVAMMKRVKNVDHAKFPHYLSDYDLFCRLKQTGCPLRVSYETFIAAHIEETGIMPVQQRTTFKRVWAELFSRRSMTNVVDHWRFASRHAPPALRARVRLLIALRALHRFIWASPIGAVLLPLPRIIVRVVRPPYRFAKGVILRVGQFLMLPRPLTEEEVKGAGFDIQDLIALNVLQHTPADGWFRIAPSYVSSSLQASSIAGALRKIAAPLSLSKIRKLQQYRGSLRARHATSASYSLQKENE